MSLVVAYFDDSGAPEPAIEAGPFFCFGMVVIPGDHIRACSDAWRETLQAHVKINISSVGFNEPEIKSSALHSLHWAMSQAKSLRRDQIKFLGYGLDTPKKVSGLISAIWGFLAQPPVPVKYLAAIVNKDALWSTFQREKWGEWKLYQKSAPTNPDKQRMKQLSGDLAWYAESKAFEFLFQRLHYLGGDKSFPFDDALVIGDDATRHNRMRVAQADFQSGLGKYTRQEKILNNVVFGSSEHNPPLQMADWIAFAVRSWAERRSEGDSRLAQVAPHFRGYPDKLTGVGIVPIPYPTDFPELPRMQ